MSRVAKVGLRECQESSSSACVLVCQCRLVSACLYVPACMCLFVCASVCVSVCVCVICGLKGVEPRKGSIRLI